MRASLLGLPHGNAVIEEYWYSSRRQVRGNQFQSLLGYCKRGQMYMLARETMLNSELFSLDQFILRDERRDSRAKYSKSFISPARRVLQHHLVP